MPNKSPAPAVGFAQPDLAHFVVGSDEFLMQLEQEPKMVVDNNYQPPVPDLSRLLIPADLSRLMLDDDDLSRLLVEPDLSPLLEPVDLSPLLEPVDLTPLLVDYDLSALLDPPLPR